MPMPTRHMYYPCARCGARLSLSPFDARIHHGHSPTLTVTIDQPPASAHAALVERIEAFIAERERDRVWTDAVPAASLLLRDCLAALKGEK